MPVLRLLPALLLAAALAAPAGAQMVLASSTTFSSAFADQAFGLARASNGDLYVAGYVSSSVPTGSADIWLARYNSSLVLQSSAVVAGSGGDYDVAYNLVVAADGTVYAVGYASAASYGPVGWMGRFSSSLVLLSSATYPWPSSFAGNLLRGLAFTPAGELFTAGNIGITTTTAQVMIAKHDPATLAMISSVTFTNNAANPEAEILVADTSGFLYVGGSVPPASGTSNDLWLAKYDTSLVFQSSAIRAGPAGNSDMARSILVHPNGSIYATGIMNNAGVTNDLWVGRYSSSLVLQSSFSINGSAANRDEGNGLALGNGGNILVSGSVSQTGQSDDIFYGEYTAGLALVSSRTLTSPGANMDYGYAVVSDTATGQAWVAGNYNGDVWLARFSITPATPTAPSGFGGTAQSTHTILWSWTDNSSAEDGYRVMTASGVDLSGSLAAGTSVWLQTGLAINATTGSMLVQAFNAGGTADSAPTVRYTLAAAPGTPGLGSVYQTSATITWAAGGNPLGTTFQIERSTGTGFGLHFSQSGTVVIDSTLTPGGTYYYRVRAVNYDGLATAYSSSSTAIVALGAAPAAPSGFAGTALSTTSIRWSWTDNSTIETGFRVMSGSASLSGNLAANTTIWTQTGLPVNASTGPLFVQAFNSTGTADSGAASRFTLTSVPAGLAASNVFQTSVTVSWTGNGTTYQLERSTGAGYVLLSTSAATSHVDTGLSPASTGFYRVLAYNGDGVSTAYSSITVVTQPTPLPNVPTAFAGTALSTGAILWSWTETATNETGYRVMSGLANLSGDLAADTTVWLQSGLGANVSTGPLHVQGFNASGGVNSSTASRTTLAAVPAGLAAAGVQQTSVTVNWTAGGNPGGTVYELERSTGPGYLALVSTTSLSYFDGYLTPSVTHYYRVRAVNGEAVASAYASSIAVVALPAPPLPGMAGTPAGAALGTSSLTWTWVLASGATNHFLFRASDNAYLGSSTSGPFVQTALSPNVPYGLRAAGVNVGGTGPLSPSGTVYTLATAPSNPVSSAVAYSSMTVSWGLNGSAAGTTAQLQRSTNAVVYSTIASGAIVSYADADLLGCTTYHYRVRHVNGDGFATAYATAAFVTANTVPGPPAALTAAANAGGTVSLAWNASPTEGVTGYRLFWDSGSGAVSYAAPIATLSSGTFAWTSGVLASSGSYTFALRTAHRCGIVETTGALAMSGAAAAAPAVRAAIREPDSGKRIRGNRVTILGELIAGERADVQQILFQYKSTAASVWTNVVAANANHSNPDLSFPYFTHWNVTLLADGPYDLRAVAYDRDGVPDAAPPAVRVTVTSNVNDCDIDENDDNGKVKKNQTLSNLVSSVVDTAGAGAADPSVRVTIPAGAVSAATATVSVIANPAITTAPPRGFNLVGSSIKIDLSNGQTALNGTALISLTYPETILFPSLLQIYYLDEATGQWSRDFASTVDTASRTVTGSTPHFSTFALLLGTAFAPNLDSVRVYPVPYKPNGPNADEGRPFSAGDANSGIIFANLAQGSEIKIYTLGGRLVAGLDGTPISGVVRWDARNQDGRDAASGAYFAVIKAPGQKSVVKKLVIIR